jgi:hypothetical protein
MIAEVTTITKKHAVFTITLTTYLEKETKNDSDQLLPFKVDNTQ